MTSKKTHECWWCGADAPHIGWWCGEPINPGPWNGPKPSKWAKGKDQFGKVKEEHGEKQ